MRINHKTQLFEDFSYEEAEEMLKFSQEIVLNGTVPHPVPKFIALWMSELGYSQDQFLLVISVVIPQRVMLSLLTNA